MAHQVALVGLGKMGSEYAKAIESHPLFEVVAAVSPSLARAEDFARRFGIPMSFDRVDEACRSSRADAAIISVPPAAVSSVVREAWLQPWKCLIEKPAGNTLEESASLLSAQGSALQIPSVAFNRRFYSHIEKISAFLSTHPGEKFIVARDQHIVSAPVLSAQDNLFGRAIHMVDLFSFLLSENAVHTHTNAEAIGQGGFFVNAEITFSGGSTVKYISVLNAPGRWSLSVYTEQDNWDLQPLEEGRHTTLGPLSTVDVDLSAEDQLFKPGIWRMLDELALDLEGKNSKLPTMEDSHKSMSLLAEIFSPLGVER